MENEKQIEAVFGKIRQFFLRLWKGSSDPSRIENGPDDPAFWTDYHTGSFVLESFSKSIFDEKIKEILLRSLETQKEKPDRVIPLTVSYTTSSFRVSVWGYAIVCYPDTERTECFKYHIEATLP